MREKVFSYKDIDRLLTTIKNKKVVLVGGCFDIFHYGHLSFLRKAKQVGDFLLIALESDDFILARKKRKSIHNQKQRAEILANLVFVDGVILLPYFNSDKQYFQLTKTINPAIIAVSENDPAIKKKQTQANKIKSKIIKVCPFVEGYSSNKILEILNAEL